MVVDFHHELLGEGDQPVDGSHEALLNLGLPVEGEGLELGGVLLLHEAEVEALLDGGKPIVELELAAGHQGREADIVLGRLNSRGDKGLKGLKVECGC